MKAIKISAILAIILCINLSVFSQESGDEYSSEGAFAYKDFRFSFGGGYAYRLGRVLKTNDRVIDDLNSDLRNGFIVEGDMQYYFKESWGLGLNVHYTQMSASANGISIPEYGLANTYEETQKVLLIGPAFVTRNETDRFLLVSTIGLGPIFYTDDVVVDGFFIRGKKATLGMTASISGEYKVNEKVGLGLKASLISGSVKSLTMSGQNVELDEAMSVSSLSIGAFLSFRSW